MSTSLKIAVVTATFPIVSETFIVNQILNLKAEGHEVCVFCHIVNNNPILDPRISNLMPEVKRLHWKALMPTSKLQRFKKAIRVLFLVRQLMVFMAFMRSLNVFNYGVYAFNGVQFFKTYYHYYFEIKRYDVVHIHFANHALGLAPLLKRFKGKKVVTFHGFDAHKFDSEFYKPLMNIETIQYTVNSHYTKDKVLALGFKANNIAVLPMGIDSFFFKPSKARVNSKVFTILFVGRFIPLKAPLLAIKIVERLLKQEHDVQFNMVGSGPEFEQCREYILKQQLEKHIHLIGDKTQSEVVVLMGKSAVFLFPGVIDDEGRCETQGLVLQEAQAMELPVIISNVGGMHEGVIPKKTGFVVKANDIDGFVECLKLLLVNRPKRELMGKAGRVFVTKYYDTRVLGKQLLNLYQTP